MLGRLPMDASFPRPRSLVWLLSGVLRGEGTQTVEAREQCLWLCAHSASQARIDHSISVLEYRQCGCLTWLPSYLHPVPWKLWSSPLPSARGPGENAELERVARRWQRDGQPVSGCEEFHPRGARAAVTIAVTRASVH